MAGTIGIAHERARELAGEHLRWFDLKRTGKLLERVRLHNPDAREFVQEHHLVRPIPQGQLEAVSNKDEFTQNPGPQLDAIYREERKGREGGSQWSKQLKTFDV